eukprot:gb/GEZJ01000481.1/.p1 GENE.gb/GEZJ01000481.1/~~gb/GEZJ01000481.1/.p1  ORF type:complete len:206 (-),score=10.04 gb/GEZJ01000481.1/:3207-3824(-)
MPPKTRLRLPSLDHGYKCRPDVKALVYVETRDSPERRVFNEHLHYLCVAGNPCAESVECDRARLILPRNPHKVYCTDTQLVIDNRRKNVEKVRKYCARHRGRENRTARRRCLEKRYQKDSESASSATSKSRITGQNQTLRVFMTSAEADEALLTCTICKTCITFTLLPTSMKFGEAFRNTLHQSFLNTKRRKSFKRTPTAKGNVN